MASLLYAIWDVIKVMDDGVIDFYFLLFSVEDRENASTSKPRGRYPPVKGKLFRLDKILDLIPVHHMVSMVESFFEEYGEVTHMMTDYPKMCSSADLPEIKYRMSYYNVN